jgi:transposase-like protein
MGAAADVQALAQELDIERSLLYGWRRLYIRGGCGGTAEQWPAAGGADASVRSQRGV